MTETINGVPLELLKRAVQIPSKASVEENHAAIVDRGRAQAELRDMLNAVPVPEAKAQVYEPLVCDYCNAETQDPWHGSGMLNGAESRHIHACSQCRNLLPTTKAQCVVMPERWNVPRPMWKDARQPYGNPLNHADIEAAEKFNLALDEVARLNAAPVQQVSVPASAFASRAITHYEAALLAAFPSGSSGEVFNQWNEARRVLAAAPAAPAADASDVLEQAMYTLISIGYHENSGLVHELRQAIAANRVKGVV